MKTKIAIGVAVAVVVSCCGFALWRHFFPNHHASGDKGCYASVGASDKLAVGKCDAPHEAEIIDFFYPDGAEEGCHKAAEEFLGGPLRDARVEVRLTTYVREDYTSNGCALVEVNDSDGTSTMHVGSLRGTMAKNRPMAITCGRMDDEVMVYLECTEPHSAEYAGAVLDGGQPEVSCRKVVTDYLGLSADEFDRRGDLAVRWLGKARDGGLTGCVVAEAKERGALTGSVKGLKSAALPVT